MVKSMAKTYRLYMCKCTLIDNGCISKMHLYRINLRQLVINSINFEIHQKYIHDKKVKKSILLYQTFSINITVTIIKILRSHIY